jgi:hypothetical protein
VTANVADLLQAIDSLHRRKDAAYGNAWKKRGEVLSIVANIARKVDRLENVVQGAFSDDETALDTAVDLLVYCLKYETFLADQDAATELRFALAPEIRPHSEGTEAVASLLAGVAEMHRTTFVDEGTGIPASKTEVGATTMEAVAAFDALTKSFHGVTAVSTVDERAGLVSKLTLLSYMLVLGLAEKYPEAAESLIARIEPNGSRRF